MITLKQLLLFLSLLSAVSLSAQSNWNEFNEQRLKTNERAMYVLGGWAAANMAVSGLMLSGSEGADRDFHRMNIGWNAINLGIAGLGWWGSRRADTALSPFASVDEQYKIQKILLFNTGLDVGYMMGGLYLTERAKRQDEDRDQLTGWGRAIMYNGAFLFLFDIGSYFVHRSHNKKLKALLENSELTGSAQGIGLRIRF